jgi:site-specific DNA recombinase
LISDRHNEETSDGADDHLLSIPWQKPPSRKSRQILIPHGIPKSEIRPTRIERRARLVSAIARGRRWLDEIVSGSVTDVQLIASRQKCSVRQVNMTISLAFLAPDLVRARSKVVCHAALESSDFVMPQQNGASSSKPSD